MGWFSDVPRRVHVDSVDLLVAGRAIDMVEEEHFGEECRREIGERPGCDWAATTVFSLAHWQLGQMLEVINSELELDVRAFSGTEVSKRLRDVLMYRGVTDARLRELDWELTAVGEAVDLWRALHVRPEPVVSHGFEGGMISITTGPDLPELRTLNLRGSEFGELHSSPMSVLKQATRCTHIAAMLSIEPELSKELPTTASSMQDAGSQDFSMEQDRVMTESDGAPVTMANMGIDHFTLVVSREDVESGDIGTTLAQLRRLLESRKAARTYFERVAVYFDGYNDTTAELFQIPEVRSYVQELDREFPYWLYFADKSSATFDVVWRCHLAADLAPGPEAQEQLLHLEELLRSWWIPSARKVCAFVEMSDADTHAIVDRSFRYLRGERNFDPLDVG